MGRHDRKEFKGEWTGIELEMRTAPPGRRFEVERGHHSVDGGHLAGKEEDEKDIILNPG